MSDDIQDSQLVAYIDGKLNADDATALEERLAEDVELQARVAALDPLAAQVRTAFEGVPGHHHMLPPLPPASEARPEKRVKRLAAVAIFAALAIGGTLGSQFGAPAAADSPWRVEVARYQALYVEGTLSSVSDDSLRISGEFSRASSALGLDLDPTPLSDIPGLTLRRAQVLGYEGNALIQIAFTDQNGAPVALCLMAGDDGTAGSAELAGLATYSWGAGDRQYVLVAPLPVDQVEAFAQSIRAELG